MHARWRRSATVGSQGGVTAAAAVLHLTPSAVSQQVAVLQREAGVALTERVGRGLRLTPAGEALAAAAWTSRSPWSARRRRCDAFLERPEGVVRVSAFQSGAELLLPGLLTRVGRARRGSRSSAWTRTSRRRTSSR